jgi:hypothetical protein
VDENLITGLRAVISLFEHIATDAHAYAERVQSAAALEPRQLEACELSPMLCEPSSAGGSGSADSLYQTPPQTQRAAGLSRPRDNSLSLSATATFARDRHTAGPP